MIKEPTKKGYGRKKKLQKQKKETKKTTIRLL